MNDEEIMHRLKTEPDFIAIKRFDHSIAELEKKHPDGCPDRLIAAALNIEEADVHERMRRIVETCKIQMRITED